MPVLKNLYALELVRGLKLFLNVEAGLVRGPIPVGGSDSEPGQPRKPAANKDREFSGPRKQPPATSNGTPDNRIDPGNLIWMFGTGRSGSTWLSDMMHDLEGHSLWFEPMVGKLFGDLYYTLGGRNRRNDRNFVLGGEEDERQAIVRSFVLREVFLRFPELMDGGYLVVKEPNGSIGAPLLMEALPESRMIFLIRDLRDSIASFMDAHKKGSWMYERRDERGKAMLDKSDDKTRLLRRRSNEVLQEMEKAREAYEAHGGHKVLVRYEDLRADALGTMKRIYSELEIPMEHSELVRVVEKHSWENIPEDEKGAGKFKRKAEPGSWKQDLTPQQIKIVESIVSPIMEEYYPD